MWPNRTTFFILSNPTCVFKMFGNFLKKNSRLSSFRYMSSTVDITIKWQNISSFHHHRELNIFFKTVQFGEAELLIINNFWNNFKLILKKKNISNWVDFCIWGWFSKTTVFIIYLLNYFSIFCSLWYHHKRRPMWWTFDCQTSHDIT